MNSKPTIYYLDDEQEFIDKFEARHKDEYSIRRFSSPVDLLKALEDEKLPDLVLLDLFYKREEVSVAEQNVVDDKLRELEESIDALSGLVRAARDLLGLRVLEAIRTRSVRVRPELKEIPVLLYTRRGISLLKDDDIRRLVANRGEWMIKNPSSGKETITSYTEKVCIDEVIRRGYEFSIYRYLQRVTKEIPEINNNPLMLDYLKESRRAFEAGCYQAASVLLGVAIEHATLLLIEAIKGSTYKGDFNGVPWNEKYTSKKVGVFWSKFINNEEHIALFPEDLKENLLDEVKKMRNIICYNRDTSAHANIVFKKMFLAQRIQNSLELSPFQAHDAKIFFLRSIVEILAVNCVTLHSTCLSRS